MTAQKRGDLMTLRATICFGLVLLGVAGFAALRSLGSYRLLDAVSDPTQHGPIYDVQVSRYTFDYQLRSDAFTVAARGLPRGAGAISGNNWSVRFYSNLDDSTTNFLLASCGPDGIVVRK